MAIFHGDDGDTIYQKKSGIGLPAENKVIGILSNYLHKHIDKQHKK